MTIFIFTILANLWIWKIFSSNLILWIILILASWLLYIFYNSIQEHSERSRRDELNAGISSSFCGGCHKNNILRFFLLFLLGIILFFQWKMTPVSSLTNLDNDQIRVKDMRLREYPPVFLKIGPKTLWIPVARWFEERKEAIALGRLTDNFFSTLDINQYFFAGHPRERVGMKEFEKYPYVLLPFFIFGLFKIVKQKEKRFYPPSRNTESVSSRMEAKSFSLRRDSAPDEAWGENTSKVRSGELYIIFIVLPIILITIIGVRCPLGIFSLFPAFTVAISIGLKSAYNSIQEPSDLIGDELNTDMPSSIKRKPCSLGRGGCHEGISNEYRKIAVTVFVFSYILVFIQLISR